MTESMTSQQLQEPIDPQDRAAIARHIAAYEPGSEGSSSIVTTLCLHTDIWLLWNEAFEMICYQNVDVDRLTRLTIAIMDLAEVTGELENSTWLDDHRTLLSYQAREDWDDLFSNAEPAQLHHAGRRNLNAYLARINAAGITDSKAFFIEAFGHILEPTERVEWLAVDVITVEDLVMLEDYFKFAGVWMQTQFDVKPVGEPAHLKQMMTYTEERWERWKQNLKALADGGDLNLRFSARDALDAMG